MTSWNAWFARTQSPMIERRASPGSRARSSFEIPAKCCSFSSCSDSTSGVILFVATSVAIASSSARTTTASCSSSREIVRTRTPRFGTKETRPSAASLRSASRIGVRETLNCSESCSCRRTVPGSSSPETIASSITSAMSSAFVLSRTWVMRPSPRTPSVESFVGGQGQEVLELVGERKRGKELFRLVARLHRGDLVAHLLFRDAAVAHPLPDLRAGDLGCRGVLHEVVDRRGADPVQPGVEVADADGDVRVDAGVGDLARRVGDGEERRLVGDDLRAEPLELVRPLAERRVEDQI